MPTKCRSGMVVRVIADMTSGLPYIPVVIASPPTVTLAR